MKLVTNMTFKNLVRVLLFTLLINATLCFNYKKVLSDAINRAKTLYKNKFGKNKAWHFLGYDPSEYPGTHENLRKINRDKWEEYYECLMEQKLMLENQGSIIPEAILAFEGGSVKFECKVCLNPSEAEDIDSVEWEWSNIENDHLKPIEITEHILVSPEEKTLHMYNLGIDQTGQYVCKLRNQLTAPYFLTVVSGEQPLREVHPHPKEKEYTPESSVSINKEIILDTMWGEWSPCSTCDEVGRRHKIGYCLVILMKNLDDVNPAENSTENITVELSTTKHTEITDRHNRETDYLETNTKLQVTEPEMEILRVFKYGIPCNSHILPHSIKNAVKVKNRRNEIMVGYCKVPCPEHQLFVVKDKDGEIIETANNSAGIYSMVQGVPNVEPPIERRLQFEAAEDKVTLSCPGNLNSDTPIQWQIGAKKVVPALLSNETHGRIYVSLLDRIKINFARISDTNVYSCWQEKELVGTIRLIVEKKTRISINQHITLLGILLIISTMLYVFILAFFGREHAIE